MSTRTTLRPSELTDIDMSASGTSDATILQSLSMINYAISWSGSSPVGTLSLQISNDYSLDASGQILNTGTWNDVPLNVAGSLSTSISISGNTGKGSVDVTATGAYAVRLSYTRVSGSGTMTIVVAGKVA